MVHNHHIRETGASPQADIILLFTNDVFVKASNWSHQLLRLAKKNECAKGDLCSLSSSMTHKPSCDKFQECFTHRAHSSPDGVITLEAYTRTEESGDTSPDTEDLRGYNTLPCISHLSLSSVYEVFAHAMYPFNIVYAVLFSSREGKRISKQNTTPEMQQRTYSQRSQ